MEPTSMFERGMYEPRVAKTVAEGVTPRQSTANVEWIDPSEDHIPDQVSDTLS